jgi:uncharacterized protein YkwD
MRSTLISAAFATGAAAAPYAPWWSKYVNDYTKDPTYSSLGSYASSAEAPASLSAPYPSGISGAGSSVFSNHYASETGYPHSAYGTGVGSSIVAPVPSQAPSGGSYPFSTPVESLSDSGGAYSAPSQAGSAASPAYPSAQAPGQSAPEGPPVHSAPAGPPGQSAPAAPPGQYPSAAPPGQYPSTAAPGQSQSAVAPGQPSSMNVPGSRGSSAPAASPTAYPSGGGGGGSGTKWTPTSGSFNSAAHEASYSGTQTSEAACSTAASDYKQTALNLHNKYRAQHQAGSVTWDDDLACVAQRQADTCIFDHLMYHSPLNPRSKN